jgi:RNA polymerase sigma-70 factor (ECF subfamily)
MEAASRQAATIIDPKLLSRVAKGDLEAFSLLYDQSNVLLFTLAYRILGSREDAALLLQEVYLEVWRKVVRYDHGRGTPVSWLVTLTRSRALDRIRSGVSRGSHTVADALNDPSSLSRREPISAGTAMDGELRPLLTQAIAELPVAQQQAVEMAYYQGLSHAEIAAKLNQPLGTVKTRIKLAMIKLRASLHTALEQHHP